MSAFSTILLTLVTTMLINNVVLSQFMGLCPFLGVSKQIKTALGMGAAVIFVITASSAVTAVLYRYVLLRYDLTYLNTIVFIVVIAALVQFVEMILRKFSPALYRALGVYLPLITTNCAVLGVALTNVQKDASVGMSVLNGFGTAAGFALSHSAAGRHPGEDRAQSGSQGVPGNAHHAPDSGTDGNRVLWLQVAGVKGAYL